MRNQREDISWHVSLAAAARFAQSQPERDVVRERSAVGASPQEIDSPKRVELWKEQHAGRVGLERQIGVSNFVSVAYLPLGTERARAVGCIRQNGRRIGTGFMITPTLVITNHHVIADEARAAASQIEFDFEDNTAGGMKTSHVFALDPDAFFVASPEEELDYAIIAVLPVGNTGGATGAKLADFGHIPLIARTGKALRGQWLNIVQHPLGGPKSVAFRDNQLTAILPKHLHYETDTEPGSSGSPVFNDSWEVVCLHHAGVPAKDPRSGALLARDGEPLGSRSSSLLKWIGNEGVRISRIIPDVWIRAGARGKESVLVGQGFPRPVQNPTPDEEAIQGEVPGSARMNGPHAAGSASTSVPQNTLLVGVQAADAHGGHRGGCGCGDRGGTQNVSDTAPSRTTTVEIPLRIRVSIEVGGARADNTASDASNVGAVMGGSGSGWDSGSGAGSSTIRGTGAGWADSSEESAALALLEAARGRVYFDVAADERDKRAYYAQIDAGSGMGAGVGAGGLRRSLGRLLESTHKVRPAYNKSRIQHLYPWVDLQRNGKLRSIYSNLEYDPAESIRADFEVARGIEASLRERAERESFSAGALEAARAELEAGAAYNCEHVVPQSWFGKQEPMRGDLHHLFACESDCNSARGNKPYQDFGQYEERFVAEESERPNCGMNDGGRFEPFMGKGKVARATLYFLVRHDGRLGSSAQGKAYDAAGVRTLLEWHRAYPVTEHERHRNQAIGAIQGNRNPFIDHPEWASRVF